MAVNLTILILLPVISVFTISIHVVSASISCLCYSIVFLKIFSYHHVNYWCRFDKKQNSHQRRNSGDHMTFHVNGNIQSLVQYPDNLTLKDAFYFLYVPTLCYELNFPRSDRIRKRFLIKRLLEVVSLWIPFSVSSNILSFQWLVPGSIDSTQFGTHPAVDGSNNK